MKIGLVAYRGGNVRSIRSALETLGAVVVYSDRWSELSACAGLVFPGVGAAPPAVEDLKNRGLWEMLPHWERPFLGICLGMQLLGQHSEEGDVSGMGVFPEPVQRFRQAPRLPHIGWNLVRPVQPDPLWEGLPETFYAYFVHSYRMPAGGFTIAQSEYGEVFAAAVCRGLYRGVQFHPEKSGATGMQILANFLKLCSS